MEQIKDEHLDRGVRLAMAEWWTDPAMIGAIAALVGMVVVVLGTFRWLYHWLSKHDMKHLVLDEVPGHLKDIDAKVSVLLVQEQRRDSDFINRLKLGASSAGNPYNPTRRNELIDKYQSGTITLDEANELLRYLREDAATTSSAVNVSGVVGLQSLVYLLTRKLSKE